MVNSIENTSATVDSGMDSVVSVGTEGEANDSKSSGIGTGTGGQIAARMRSASSSALSKSHDKLIGAPPVNRIRTVPQRGWHQLYCGSGTAMLLIPVICGLVSCCILLIDRMGII